LHEKEEDVDEEEFGETNREKLIPEIKFDGRSITVKVVIEPVDD
jgi:hypothetical protein